MIFRTLDETIEILRDLVNLVRSEEDTSIKSMILREIGGNFADLGLFDEAKELLLDAYKYASEIKDVDKMISEILEISRDLYSMGFSEESIRILEKALENADSLIEIEDKLFLLIQLARELLEIKCLDLAREVVERIINMFFSFDPSEIEDVELLIYGFKLIIVFEKGRILRKIYSVILARLEEESNETIDEYYLDLLDVLIDLNWFSEIRDIILNRIRSIDNKVEAASKLVEKVNDNINKAIKENYS